MTDLFTLENLFTLGMLTALQAVLGFDNLLYISLESKRVPEEKQAYVRWLGTALAIIFRIALLYAIVSAIKYLRDPFFETHWTGIIEASISIHSLIVLGGGVFIIYTATKEIFHMLSIDDLDGLGQSKNNSSVGKAVFWIIIMNIVFSFDSILSAIALTDVFAVMATAIVISGAMMIWLADRVAIFLEKNRMYEVLGLFILLIVGVMLLSEGGHIAHLQLFGQPITPMNKTTFYFVITVLVVVDVVQGRYEKKLSAQQ